MADFLEEGLSAQDMPFSAEAEQSVLGAMLIEPSCIATVLQYISSPDCFYRPQHRQLFGIMLQMFTVGENIDFITVLEQAKAQKVFASDEDAKVYLAQLAQVVPSVSNIESYAAIVQEKHYIRSLVFAAKDIVEMSHDPQIDAKTLLDSAEHRIFSIRQGREAGGLIPIEEIILSTYDQLQRLSGDDRSEYAGIPSGFSQLDQVTTGLNKSDLILLAARPGVGKSAFALNIAANVATKVKKAVAIFSLEMSREQLVLRILSSEASIQSQQLRTGTLSASDWERLALSAQMISSSPIYIDDTPGITVAEMKAKLRRVHDLGLVIIDYLQLMSTGRRIDNRVQEISEITRSLKIMAKELDVPVISLSQLSRSVESRSDHMPMLSDLRDSGSIEQDADIVLFLYRSFYYTKDPADENIAKCIIAKNRHGETNTIDLGWEGQFTRFTTLERFRNA